MTSEDLIQANSIKKEMRELELFIYSAEKVWKGKVTKRTSKYIFKTLSYGAFDEAEYHMDTRMKDKVLNVLREHLKSLKIQLQNL